jgi:hypothetical protein
LFASALVVGFDLRRHPENVGTKAAFLKIKSKPNMASLDASLRFVVLSGTVLSMEEAETFLTSQGSGALIAEHRRAHRMILQRARGDAGLAFVYVTIDDDFAQPINLSFGSRKTFEELIGDDTFDNNPTPVDWVLISDYDMIHSRLAKLVFISPGSIFEYMYAA